jgi:hypothetical protein
MYGAFSTSNSTMTLSRFSPAGRGSDPEHAGIGMIM